jgi:ATP-dependent exoDNAse (exonuclease V) alpha subunit
MRTGEQVENFFENLETEGLIQFGGSADVVRLALVDRYMESAEPLHEKLVIGSTNDEVKLLNEVIRERLIAEDMAKLEKDRQFTGESIEIEHPKGGTASYCAGDRIVITQNNLDDEVKNGQIGTIEKIIKSSDGWVIQFLKDGEKRPTTLNLETDAIGRMSYNLLHGFALTSYKTQGKHPHSSRNQTNSSQYP